MTLDKSGNAPTVAGAFTPLWSAAGGLLGPAFMPGFCRDRNPKRARPNATISAASCRDRKLPRIDSASSTGRLGGHAVPRPSSNGAWSSTRAQARAYKAKGRERPSVRIHESLIIYTNPAPPPTIDSEEPHNLTPRGEGAYTEFSSGNTLLSNNPPPFVSLCSQYAESLLTPNGVPI
jgi:hypothetical protein